MNKATETDRIERSVVINAPRARVWHALTNAEEFGTWFGANLKGQTFAPGKRARGNITFAGWEHVWFDVVVDRIEPQDLLSYRWHPYAVDPAVDYEKEEPTLVTFTLKDAPGNATLPFVEMPARSRRHQIHRRFGAQCAANPVEVASDQIDQLHHPVTQGAEGLRRDAHTPVAHSTRCGGKIPGQLADLFGRHGAQRAHAFSGKRGDGGAHLVQTIDRQMTVAGQPLALAIENARHERQAARVVVQHPGSHADRAVQKQGRGV